MKGSRGSKLIQPLLRDESFADQGVVDFLDRLPRHLTYSERAAACLEHFGAARAWDADKIARYWKWRHPKGTGRTSRIALDADLRDFVEDRLGCVTLDELTDVCYPAVRQTAAEIGVRAAPIALMASVTTRTMKE